MSAIAGIDFGNDTCVVAVAKRDAFGLGIDVVQNEVGQRKTPSIVAYSHKQRMFADEAIGQYMSNIANSFVNLKRMLGRPPADPELEQERPFLPYKLTTKDGRLAFEATYEGKREDLLPEQVAAAMLAKMKDVAQSGLNQAVRDVVIGVPGWWSEQMRRALLDAGTLAGFNVLCLLNELTAVALYYYIPRCARLDAKARETQPESKVMFIDIGHSTTQTSIVSFHKEKVTVLAQTADRHLGGRSFDQLLVEHLIAYVKERFKLDVYSNAKAVLKIRKEAQRIKHVLSANSKVPWSIEYLMEDRDVNGMVERAEFEEMMSKELLPRIIKSVQQALEISGVKKEELAAVEIVGGGVRIPAVQRALEEFLGRPLSKTCDGDESVARGCAWQATLLSPGYRLAFEIQLKDTFPYAIDLNWGPVDADKIPAGTTAPTEGKVEGSQLFPPFSAVQSSKVISFKERLQPFQFTASYSTPDALPFGTNPVIGKYVVHGMPQWPRPDGKTNEVPPTVKVRARLHNHGTFNIEDAEFIEEEKEEVIETPPPAEVNKDAKPMDADKPADAGQPTDAQPMDTDESKKAEAPAEAEAAQTPAPAPEKKKYKKKTVRTVLKVEAHRTGGLTDAEYRACEEREAYMANQDRVVYETLLARNTLEAYILNSRNAIEGELASFVKAEEGPAVLKRLEEVETWMYDEEEVPRSEYKKRLEELQALCEPIKKRHFELTNREDFVRNFKQSIAKLQNLANSTEPKYAHITPEERQQVVDETNEADNWLFGELQKMDSLKPSDDPTCTTEQIKAKQLAFETKCLSIMTRPKPVEKKPEEKKPEEPQEAAANAEASANANGEAAAEAEPEDGKKPMES